MLASQQLWIRSGPLSLHFVTLQDTKTVHRLKVRA